MADERQLNLCLELGSRKAVREAIAIGLGMSFIYESEANEDSRTRAAAQSGLEGSSVDILIYPAEHGARRRIKPYSRSSVPASAYRRPVKRFFQFRSV